MVAIFASNESLIICTATEPCFTSAGTATVVANAAGVCDTGRPRFTCVSGSITGVVAVLAGKATDAGAESSVTLSTFASKAVTMLLLSLFLGSVELDGGDVAAGAATAVITFFVSFVTTAATAGTTTTAAVD